MPGYLHLGVDPHSPAERLATDWALGGDPVNPAGALGACQVPARNERSIALPFKANGAVLVLRNLDLYLLMWRHDWSHL